MSHLGVYIVVMNIKHASIDGPYSHQNLDIFILRGSDAFEGNQFIPLDEALERKCATVYETSSVGQLEVENHSEEWDLYIQAGDVVKGGKQDRTLGVDFVLPPRSGRVPIVSFCVENGRQEKRGEEEVRSFSSSTASLSSKKLRMAAKDSKCQSEVWTKIAETQADLSAAIEKPVASPASPNSYQLTTENVDLLAQIDNYSRALSNTLDETPNAIGYAFVINGEINSADVYGSAALFRKLWKKLLHAAIVEAIGERHRKPDSTTNQITSTMIMEWLAEAEKATLSSQQEIPPRVRMDRRSSQSTVVFDTFDHGLNDALLHKNVVAQ